MSDTYQISRRKFLTSGACGALGMGSLTNTITQLQLMSSATASTAGGADLVGEDYKALICIFLRGGCDMNNVLIPITTNPQAAAYLRDRDVIAIRNGVGDAALNPSGANDALPLTLPGDPLGLHPSLPRLAAMINSGGATFVTNVGTLTEPTTPANYGRVSLPHNLFSHSDQVAGWRSSIADKPNASGWGARVADLYHDNWNPQSGTSLLMSTASINQFTSGPSISEAIKIAADINLDLDTHFAQAQSPIGGELKAIARLIAGRKALANRRQIFFLDYAGFDHHQHLNIGLSELLSELDQALGAFDHAMTSLAELDKNFRHDQVTTFQVSDFNRTWTPNQSDAATAGTDHGWGTHVFVMGGAVHGGQLYGQFPELAVGGLVDVPRGDRGRWIPTTSVDQYCAVLANWLGVPMNSSEMQTIFPNLGRFADPFDSSHNLSFL